MSEKSLVFVREFLRDRNATRAAVAAGYAARTASQAGSRLLRNVKVREKIDAETAKHLTDLKIDAARVLRGIAQLAFYDPRQLFTPDGKLKSISELDETCAMAIKGIDIDTVVNLRRVRPIEPKKDAKDETKAAKGETKAAETETPAAPTHEEVLEVRTITKKIRLADRGENLERLGRNLKLFTDRLEFEDTTPYDEKRDDARIVQLLAQAVRAVGQAARP